MKLQLEATLQKLEDHAAFARTLSKMKGFKDNSEMIVEAKMCLEEVSCCCGAAMVGLRDLMSSQKETALCCAENHSECDECRNEEEANS